MAVSLLAFKKFAKIYVPPTLASSSVGIIVLTKTNPSSVIDVPVDTVFSTDQGIDFKNQEQFTISESELFKPIGVISTGQGQNQNIEANQTWATSLVGVTVTNPAPFTQGKDSDPGVPTSEHLVDWIPPSDDVLQANIDLATQNVRTKLAYAEDDDLPDKPGVDRSVYLFAQFYSQNTTTQETITSFKGGDIEKTKKEYYRERVFRAINREVDNLLAPYINVEKFMGDSA